MGIHGLTGFVGAYGHLFSDVKLRNTKLVIDGNNLYYKLYLDAGLGLVYGGNYDSFSDLVHRFFGNLEKCLIHAYVVLDGGCDVSDRKFETHKQRQKDNIRMANNLAEGKNGQVLPLMVRDVFIQILRKLQVNFVQCFSEADQEIAALANMWNCPVLTLDSDFCIYDMSAGYCPFTYFQWKTVVTSKENNECCIHAKSFSARVFCSYFNVNVSLLPLFAVLAGNDYTTLPAVQKAINTIRLRIGSGNHSGKKHSSLRELLAWLSEFDNIEEAIDNAVKDARVKEPDEVRKCLKCVLDDYDLHGVQNLEHFFKEGSYSSVAAIQMKVPGWVQSSLARGQLAPMVSDALVLRRTYLHVQVEDMKRSSAHLITRPIRQIMYGLILNAYEDLIHSHRTEQPDKLVVSEFVRQGTGLMRNSVEAIILSREFNGDLLLEKLPEVSLDIRLKLFLDTLGVKMSVLESVPPAHRLTVVMTCFWVANASPKVMMHHLKALVLGIVCGQACEMMTKPELPGEDIKLVYEKLKNYKNGHEPQGQYGRDGHGKPNLEDLHLFCQWQCCLQTGLYFNQLLCTPLQEPDVTRIYNGLFVYRLCQKLKSGSHSEDLLKPAPALEKLYLDCIQAVISSFPPGHFQSRSKSKSSRSKKEKRAAKRAHSTKQPTVMDSQCSCDVSNRFASLCEEENASC